MHHRHRGPGPQAGHKALRIIGQGNQPATVPLAPRTARTIDLAVGERCKRPILRRGDGQRVERRTAKPSVRAIDERAGLGQVHPQMLRAAFIMAALARVFRFATLTARLADPGTTAIYDPRR